MHILKLMTLAALSLSVGPAAYASSPLPNEPAKSCDANLTERPVAASEIERERDMFLCDIEHLADVVPDHQNEIWYWNGSNRRVLDTYRMGKIMEMYEDVSGKDLLPIMVMGPIANLRDDADLLEAVHRYLQAQR